MDYNQLFDEGVEVSAFIKNTNKIWEGMIITRSDGLKVVLNEDKKWKKLSDLEHVKLVEADRFSLEANKIEHTSDLVKQTMNNIKMKDKDGKALEKFGKDKGLKDKAVKGLTNLAKSTPGIKDKEKANETDVNQMFDSELTNTAANEAAENTSGGDNAKMEAAKQAMAEVEKQVTETLAELHPLLQPHLQEMTGQIFHHCRDYFNNTHDNKKTSKMLQLYGMSKVAADKQVAQWEKAGILLGAVPVGLHESTDIDDERDSLRDQFESGKIDEDEYDDAIDDLDDEDDDEEKSDDKTSLNYEDEDYLDVPEDVKTDIISRVKDMLADDQADIEETIKSNFELSDDDADEFIIQAMEEYIDETGIEPRDSIKDHDENDDEIEKAFEDAIDEYDGPDNELMTHLVTEFEIDGDDAEKIFDEKKGDLTECILAFVDIVKNRLKETNTL
jgi:hypothetical protein